VALTARWGRNAMPSHRPICSTGSELPEAYTRE
jgi:hypothetical protein